MANIAVKDTILNSHKNSNHQIDIQQLVANGTIGRYGIDKDQYLQLSHSVLYPFSSIYLDINCNFSGSVVETLRVPSNI